MDKRQVLDEVARFDPDVPLDRAWTPPKSWYTAPAFFEHERETVFRRNWHFACRTDQVADAGACVAADIAGDPYLVVRGADGELRAFHNVCKHHASRLVEDEARCDEIVCPYHGWRYELDGRLKSAPRSGGMVDFERGDFGLAPIRVEAWGPLVFVHPGRPARSVADELSDLGEHLDPGAIGGMTWVARGGYPMRCNWKVFADNYLDGGYHIPHLHGHLASQLDLATYRTILLGRSNVQTSAPSADFGAESAAADIKARISGGAIYAWLYPNLMLNRYGRMLDSNFVRPLAADRCEVVFDFWFDGDPDEARAFLDETIQSSDVTQKEDVWISEQVQRGLGSVAYDRGRYAPSVEHAMHHFHRLLVADLRG